MKSILLLFSITAFFGSVFGQSLTYKDKKIYQGDVVIYEVFEVVNGRVLEDRDYIDTDSSQYYDYIIRNVNGGNVLCLYAEKLPNQSDAHYPNRFASHIVSSDYKRRALFGTITENHLTVLAGNEDYRQYLIDYILDYGLISTHGVNDKKVNSFREEHR